MRLVDGNSIGVAVFAVALAVIAVKALDVGMDAEELAEDSRPPVTIHETRLGEVGDGVVHLQFEATRHRDCKLSTTSEWERPNGVRLSRANPNKATLRAGQTRWIELEIAIPPGLKPGPYRVRSVGEYDCYGHVFIVPTGWVEVIL